MYCKTCKYYGPMDRNGHCHLNPPVVIPCNVSDVGYITRFPLILDNCWCGKYEPRASTNETDETKEGSNTP